MRYFKAPYNTPNIIYPSSQEMCFRGNLPFKWNRVQGKVGYEIYLSEDKTFNDSTKLKIIKVDVNVDSVFVDFDLKNETDYYWKIRAIDSINNSFFSPVSSFRTVTNTTILISPDDNTLGIATPISFVWEERLDASYRFQLSLHKDFSEILLDTNLMQGNLSINMKSNNTTYYWRVAVIPLSDVLCPSNFTEPFMFTTNLAAPILLNPENEVVLEKNEAFLIWEAVEAATKYELQIATDTNFTENLESFVNIINTI